MKKILALVLALTMLMATVACTAKPNAATDPADAAGTENSQTASQPDNTETESQKRHFVIATTAPNSTGEETPPHTGQKAIVYFMRKLEEVSGGLLTAEVSWGGALGKTAQLYSQTSQGTIDMVMVGLDVLGGLNGAEDTAVFSVPYLFDDYDHIHRYLQSDAFKTYFKGVEDANNLVLVGDIGPAGSRNLNTVKPVKSVEDVNNMKIRVAESKASIAVWTAWGANPVVIPATEVYSALENGLCDGWENSITAFYNMKTSEVANYISRIDYVYQGVVCLMNQDLYESLSDQEKAWVKEAFDYAYQHNMDESYGTGDYTKGAEALKIEEMLADPDFHGIFVEDMDLEGFKSSALEVAKQLEGDLFSAGLVDQIRALSNK